MAVRKQNRNWLWLPLILALGYIAWIVASEYFWRHPDRLENEEGALIQPATAPSPGPGAQPARPDNSGRDATGNAVSRGAPQERAARGEAPDN